MKLLVKILQGKEQCSVEVANGGNAADIKAQVEKQLDVPIDQQRLIHRGKPLPDDKTLEECGLRDGIKLFLMIKKPEGVPDTTSETSGLDFWLELHRFLNKHFTEEDANKVFYEYKKDFERTIASLSLDDIERLAKANLEKNAKS